MGEGGGGFGGTILTPMNWGIYLQVPFCQTRCTYCNFHTGVVARDRYQPYANAVTREIGETFATLKRGIGVESVYFGGGTPSLLEPAALGQILRSLRERAAFANDAEITLEADPETITLEKAAAWRAAGFNRISLGVQSFNDAELQAAGRMHRARTYFFLRMRRCARRDFECEHGFDCGGLRNRRRRRGRNRWRS